MSTFKGVVVEFPDIRIDFFRRHHDRRPPLACFLSHVHSDHLAGLESLKSPFVYCSPVTREILLRLEKYPHRMNFAKGILESRKQTYKHLEKLLKPIPLETPTKIELEPGNVITVTLFDANHCPGAVMFLIESDTKSILYTGDIRSEPSMITNLQRNPYLIEYTSGLRHLDCIYLDTSNSEPDHHYPTQAEGLAELIEKVKKYPKDTVFHLSAWTYGYEKVWMALSKALNSQVHVDRYKLRIYRSLVGNSKSVNTAQGPYGSHEGPVLTGFHCGNSKQEGCLTDDPEARIHSCEKGTNCPTIEKNQNVVWITPIVARLKDGTEIVEMGIGGGGGDLKQHAELELANEADVDTFLEMAAFNLSRADDEQLRQRMVAAVRSSRMTVSLDDLGLSELDRDQNELSLEALAELLSKSIFKKEKTDPLTFGDAISHNLPKRIKFPYSRHSSFEELVEFIKAFRPKDVYPCTVDEESWHEGVGIRISFGKYCSEQMFRHDHEMRHERMWQHRSDFSQQTHTTDSRISEELEEPSSPIAQKEAERSDHDPHVRGKSFGDAFHLQPIIHPTLHVAPFPVEIIARSPGSQSQNLRRKLIMADLGEEGNGKRARTSNGEYSSPLRKHGDGSDGTNSLKTEPAPIVQSEDADSGRNIDLTNLVESPLGPHTSDSELEAEAVDKGSPYRQEENYHHCDQCEMECWYKDYCPVCSISPPYLEAFDQLGSAPDVALDHDTDDLVDSDARKCFLGDYMDAESDAYDTQDEEEGFREEYEVDSFIDDASTNDSDSGDQGNDPDAEDVGNERLYNEQQYKLLESKYEAAQEQYLQEKQAHLATKMTLEVVKENLEDELIHEILDEDEDEDDFDDLEMDEDGVYLVNPATPPLAVTEVILSHAEGESQESEVSDGRIRDRGVAYVDALSGWHNISLVSTGNNHTEEELEL